MPNSGTVAIWCVPRAASNPTGLEVHINYWRIAGDKGFVRNSRAPVRDFVEIGLLIADIRQIESICIFLPARIRRRQVEDCAPFLAQPVFAQGIFNEVLAMTTPAAGGQHCIILHDQNNAIFARVHSFASGPDGIDEVELQLHEQNGGTLATITTAAVQEACHLALPLAAAYFRLRLYLGEERDANPFVKVIRPHDRLFQSGFNEIEYIDFRMNEARTLPAAIYQKMRTDRAKGGPVEFTLVAFLTAVPVHSELSVSNTPSHKMRLLEPSWDKYVSTGIPGGMVVYHWKKLPENKKSVTNFSAFVKLETRRSGRTILFTYLAIAFLFSLIGNLAATEVQREWGRIFTQRATQQPAAAKTAKFLDAPQTKLPLSGAGSARSDRLKGLGN